MFFIAFCCCGWAGMVWGWSGCGGEWMGRATCYCCWGGIFLYFSGFAIDRLKKYIKTIKNHMKIDAVNPQAAADNPPPTPQ